MAYTSIWLPPFDPDADYVAVIPFTCAGRGYGRKEPFRKDTVTTRTLRILYEQRHIAIAEPGPSTAAVEPTLKSVGFGRYHVMRGDAQLTAKPMAKDEALAYAAAQG